jgi:hypothetical protein
MKLREYFWALVYFAVSLDFSILIASMAFLLYYGNFITATYMYYYGKSVGVIAAILVFLQWAPQIWITWRINVSYGQVGEGVVVISKNTGGVATAIFIFLQSSTQTGIVGTNVL